MKRIFLTLTLCGAALCAARAQQTPDSAIVIKPRPAEETALALPDFQPKGGSADASVRDELKVLNEIIWEDLLFCGFFKLVSKSMYPSHKVSEKADIAFEEWADIGVKVDFIVTGNARVEAGAVVVECRVFDFKTKEQILGKQFKTVPKFSRAIAHRIADKIISLLTANASQGVSSTQIVFERKSAKGKEICVMDYDGANVEQLTSNGSINLTPAWYPSADRICFTSYQSGTPMLYYLSVSDRQMTPLPIKGGLLTTPAFSHSGKEVAFAGRLAESSDTDIYISSLDGSDNRNITHNSGIDISPCWSPTDRQLAFVSGRNGSPQIFLCDAYGANIERVLTEGGYASSPDWAPDGRYIVFSWKPARMANFDIFIVEVATRKIFQLTHGEGNNENPSWSPDGRHLAFQSDRSGSTEIFTMFADGTEIRQVTRLKGCFNPDWSWYANRN